LCDIGAYVAYNDVYLRYYNIQVLYNALKVICNGMLQGYNICPVAGLGSLPGYKDHCNPTTMHCNLTMRALQLVFWVIAMAKRIKSVQSRIAHVLFGLAQLL